MAAAFAADVAKLTTGAFQVTAVAGTQLAKHTVGAVMSDIKAAAVPNALVKGSGPRLRNEDELCRICRGLDLVKFFNGMNLKSNLSLDEMMLLGTYDEIVSRSYCPFCRLVLAAVNHSLRGPIGVGYRTEEGGGGCVVC